MKRMNPYNPHKVLCWPKRLRDISRGNVPKPVTLMIDPTNKCSYRCVFCSSASAPRNASLTGEDMRKLICEADDLGVWGVTFAGGGEPLDNPATPGAVKEAYDHWLETALITNGYGLGDPEAMRAAKTCKWVRISIAAGTEGQMQGTGRGTLGKLMRRLLGNDYAIEVPFSMVAGSTYQAQYTEWLDQSLMVMVSEAMDTSPEHLTRRNARVSAYERIKELAEPGGVAAPGVALECEDEPIREGFCREVLAQDQYLGEREGHLGIVGISTAPVRVGSGVGGEVVVLLDELLRGPFENAAVGVPYGQFY